MSEQLEQQAAVNGKVQETFPAPVEVVDAPPKPPHGMNGPYVPKTSSEAGIMSPERVRSVRETGFLPGNTMAPKRPKGVKYMSEILRMMQEWPESLVISVLQDKDQPIGVRQCAAQHLLALKGNDNAIDRILDRTEGKSGPEVYFDNRSITVNGGKTAITPDAIQKAFAAIEEKRKGSKT